MIKGFADNVPKRIRCGHIHGQKQVFGDVPQDQVVGPAKQRRSKNEQLVMEELKRRGGEMAENQYGGKRGKSKDSGTFFERCYHSHPPLTFPDAETGEELTLYGGSCSSPAVKDADIYIGLDHGMKFTPRHLPWNAGEEIRFPVVDHSHPKPEEMDAWRKMIGWVIEQLREGKKIHIGCIGGHGRTGLLLSCIVREVSDIADATTYVRENYCKKVVESKSQVDWLHTEFDIKKVNPAKHYGRQPKTGGVYSAPTGGGESFRNDAKIDYDTESPNNLWATLDKHGDIA